MTHPACLSPACGQGRRACAHPTLCQHQAAPAPAEACSPLLADAAHGYALAPAFRRWPRATAAVLVLAYLAMLGLAGRWDAPPQALPTPGYMPSDGFPPELLSAFSADAAGHTASAPQP